MKKWIKYLAMALCCIAAVMTIVGGIKDKTEKEDTSTETAQVAVIEA